jgi:pyridoxine 5-phosphate synthase
MSPRLAVSIDHVATVRQARRLSEPDPVQAAVLAELGGAAAICVHPRHDRRHVQDRDVEILRQVVKSRLNVKMAATQDMVRIALTVKPDQVTLVPERREEITTEGGLDVVLNSVQLRPIVKTLAEGGVEVSLFVDADLEQVKEAHKIDARVVEISTAPYAEARDARTREAALRKVVDAARLARKLGLHVHAGHGLTYQNAGAVAAVPEIRELSIGHSIVARAVLVGMERAVREMADAMRAASAAARRE